jgi:LCP family protein required for cell wall assembly
MSRSRVVWSDEQQRFVSTDEPARPAASGRSAPTADRTQIQPRPPRARPTGARTNPPAVVATSRPAPARRPPPAPPRRSDPPAPAAAPPPRPRRRRRFRRRLLLVLAVVFLVFPALLLGFGYVQYSRIEKVDVGGVLTPDGNGGTNYLIVGSDSREDIDPDDPNSAAFIGSEVTGTRTDTIMVLRVAGGESRLLSIPRDLWVRNAETGEVGRINSTYQTSPAALIQTVQQSLGIPIQHYLEIGFPAFGSLVDAVGGITVDFPYPARDLKSGLLVEHAGPVTLDGAQALAYVRSRNYEQNIDFVWQPDPTADIGRTERQRAFLTTLLGEVGAARNPLALARISRALGGGMRMDDTMSYLDTLRFVWQMKGLTLASVDLPVFGRTTSGGAAVLELDVGAAEVLSDFGATAPPAPPAG